MVVYKLSFLSLIRVIINWINPNNNIIYSYVLYATVLIIDLICVIFVEYNEEWLYLLIVWTIGLMIPFHTLTGNFNNLWTFIKKVSALFLFMLNYLFLILFLYVVFPAVHESIKDSS